MIFRVLDLGTPVSLAKTDEPIEMPSGEQTADSYLGPRNHVLEGGHIGATWRIRLNDPYTAAMRPCVGSVWQTKLAKKVSE